MISIEHPPFIQNVSTMIEALCDEMTESDTCDFTQYVYQKYYTGWDFDIVGLQKGVFKVSTIGDCYLETSGIPDIQDGHAEVISNFSVE